MVIVDRYKCSGPATCLLPHALQGVSRSEGGVRESGARMRLEPELPHGRKDVAGSLVSEDSLQGTGLGHRATAVHGNGT